MRDIAQSADREYSDYNLYGNFWNNNQLFGDGAAEMDG